MISEHKIKVLFTAPTAFRAIKKEDPEGEHLEHYDLVRLPALFLAGERADPDTVKWAEDQLKVPVIDHWWQTETGWAIAGNPLGLGILPVKHGSPTVPMPGYDVQILDEAGKPVEAGKMGSIAIKLPLPPGCLPTLWNADDAFQSSYLNEFHGYYNTSDAGFTGCRWLSLHHGPHRRHHQCRGPSPLDRRHGRSALRRIPPLPNAR